MGLQAMTQRSLCTFLPGAPAARALICLFSCVPLTGAAGGQPALYVCDSSADRIVKLVDSDRSGFVEGEAAGEISVFYDDSSPGPDLSTPSHLGASASGTIYVLDGGTLDSILALADKNLDGDANDTGEAWTFYDASLGGPRLSTPNTLLVHPDGWIYVSDDGSGAHRIVGIRDFNGDEDALDAGESKIVYDASALSLPVLDDVEALAASPGGLHVWDTTLVTLFTLRDENGDGDFLDEGEVSVFFKGDADFALGDVDTLVFQGSALYAGERDTGKILRLEDLNGDGDAGDAGEAAIFVDGAVPIRVSGLNDLLPVVEGGFLALDNSKDTVLRIVDSDGDGKAASDGEVYRWLVDDGSTLATPHGLVLLPGRDDPPGPVFLRGDATGDGVLDLSDPIATLGHLFLGSSPNPCLDALDGDDSGEVNISDPIFVLNYLFTGGFAPPAPHPEAGLDPTQDSLDC